MWMESLSLVYPIRKHQLLIPACPALGRDRLPAGMQGAGR
jgi:hypothetical protein